jgi:hypothetical protein
MAFRSVPRPSSPPGAKASTERPSLALSLANKKPKPLIPILHRNHPTLLTERKTYPQALCRPPNIVARTTMPDTTDAPSSTSILATLLNTPGCGELALSCLLRSDLQPARPDAPNPDSHVKRTNQAPTHVKTRQHPRDHRSATPSGAPLNAHTICFPTATTFPSRRLAPMEVDGIEPTTPCLQSRCSPTELHPQEIVRMKGLRFFLERKNFFLKKEPKTSTHFSQSEPSRTGGPGRI